MKKVLALILMLFVVQLSNAASIQYVLYDTSGNPVDTPLEGGQLFVNTEYWLKLVLGVEDGDDDVSGFNMTLTGVGPIASASVVDFNEKYKNGLWTYGEFMDHSDYDVLVWDIRGSSILTGPYGQDGEVLATYSLVTAGEEGWLTLDDCWGVYLGPRPPYTSKVNGKEIGISALTYYVAVPEPISMSLLGLGGLAMIRRRRVN